MRRVAPLSVALLSVLSIAVIAAGLPQKRKGQVKRPAPARRIDFSDVAVPKDEVLYDEYDRLLDKYERWRLATMSDLDAKSRNISVYYDRQSINRRPGGRVQVWVKHMDMENNVELRSHSVYLEEYDCSTRQSRTLSATSYDNDGRPIVSIGRLPSRWDYLTPDTVGETLLGIFCFNRKDYWQQAEESASRRYHYGRQAEKKGQYLTALEWYRKALDDDPNNVKIKEAIARMEEKQSGPPVRNLNSNRDNFWDDIPAAKPKAKPSRLRPE
jgi:tetratricopeptide (TPR) repeat protein